MPLLDDRWPLNLFRLDGGQRRLMVMRPQMGVHVVVVVVVIDLFLADVWWSAVHILIRVVHLFHHAVRVTVVMVRLIVGTGPLFGRVVLAARIRWPAGRGLPMGSKRKNEKR